MPVQALSSQLAGRAQVWLLHEYRDFLTDSLAVLLYREIASHAIFAFKLSCGRGEASSCPGAVGVFSEFRIQERGGDSDS
jgi:hypothetical protein